MISNTVMQNFAKITTALEELEKLVVPIATEIRNSFIVQRHKENDLPLLLLDLVDLRIKELSTKVGAARDCAHRIPGYEHLPPREVIPIS